MTLKMNIDTNNGQQRLITFSFYLWCGVLLIKTNQKLTLEFKTISAAPFDELIQDRHFLPFIGQLPMIKC